MDAAETADADVAGLLAAARSGDDAAFEALLETLVHGWDIAQGAEIDHPADEELVDTVWAYARHAIGDDQRRADMFAEPLPITPAADTFVALPNRDRTPDRSGDRTPRCRSR
ncbi:hypothetical protein [Actinomadura sp. 3N508]|uniref:hypothetical protein n=1 Tax=Actinomadura sp. 3N508 TaxID=3375153 RepID=UPI00378C63D5